MKETDKGLRSVAGEVESGLGREERRAAWVLWKQTLGQNVGYQMFL